MNSFIVIYMDYGCTCDGLARLLGKQESQEAMKNDVNFYLKQNPNLDITEESSDHILVGDEDNGCLWQILEI